MGKRIYLFSCVLFLVMLVAAIHYLEVHSFDLSMMILLGSGLMACSGMMTQLLAKEEAKGLHICRTCRLIATPDIRMKGSSFTADVLWFLCIVPGMIYSSWRHVSKAVVCPGCSSRDVIPVDSEKGKNFFDEIYSNRNTIYINQLLSFKPEDFARNDYQRYKEHYRPGDYNATN